MLNKNLHDPALFWLQRVSILWTCVLALATPSLAADSCAPGGLSSWATDWLSSAQVSSALQSSLEYSTLWLWGAVYDPSHQEFSFKPGSVLKQVQAEYMKSPNGCLGLVLHNSGPGGFDPKLGTESVLAPAAALTKLKNLLVEGHFHALQIDLESLPESEASEYEGFLSRVAKTFEGSGIRLSIALHAKTSFPGDSEIARFQRWPNLAKLPFDFVVMAYDFHWATSEPGPIAPSKWVEAVAGLAQNTFGPDHVVITLPLYGYLWKKNGKKWKGEPLLAPELEKLINGEGWKETALAERAEGRSFRKGASERVFFDDATSAKLKFKRINALGLKGLALWRLGGEGTSPVSRSDIGVK